MKHYRITIDNQTFDVEVLGNPRQQQVHVRVNGEDFTVNTETVTESPVAQAVSAPAPVIAAPIPTAAPPSTNGGTGAIKSPLPGVIKSIAVRTGQKVHANDELLIIEAMKAMNVIRAPRAGTIGAIYVAEGKQVAYGAPLLELK
jgi:biotin carboxyl carrier protein